MAKGFVAFFSSVLSIFADHARWLDPTIRELTFYGGFVVMVLTVISISYDIRRKRRQDRAARQSNQTGNPS